MRLTRTQRILALAVVVVFVLIYGFHRVRLAQFHAAYAAYAAVAEKHNEAALIPALEENPLRRDLNQALASVLSPEEGAEARLARAREGLVLLVLAEGAIDAVGDVGEDAQRALERLERSARGWGHFSVDITLRALIALSRERAEIIADIRGLSYRSNYHTKEIFDRVIADNGALTSDHVATLNRLLPAVEEQFDERSNLYDELTQVNTRIENLAAAIARSW